MNRTGTKKGKSINHSRKISPFRCERVKLRLESDRPVNFSRRPPSSFFPPPGRFIFKLLTWYLFIEMAETLKNVQKCFPRILKIKMRLHRHGSGRLNRSENVVYLFVISILISIIIIMIIVIIIVTSISNNLLLFFT